jgi:hypothetical protein
MPRWLFAPFAGVWLASAAAAPLAPAARAEIDALLSRLASSSCQVNRNGTWHDAAEARTHMLRKLEYLEKKGVVETTEQFIDLAASTSSASGKPYLVRCGQGTPVASRAWLLMQLQAMRAGGAAAPPGKQ